MIKLRNKKLKGFSLIEAMVLLTALSLILLAFLPVMLQRSKKTTDSDCVGGQRSVRIEFGIKSDKNEFTIPDKIASPITFTLIGAGGGGSDGESDDEITTAACSGDVSGNLSNGQEFYRNFFLSVAEEGHECDPGRGEGGPSGKFYANYRARLIKGSDSVNCYFAQAGVACSAGGNIFLSNLPNNYVPGGVPNRGQAILSGGVPGGDVALEEPIPLPDPDDPSNVSKTTLVTRAGIGGFCKCVIDPGSGNCVSPLQYRTYHDPTPPGCKMRYKIASAGAGGASGAYLKFSKQISAGSSCTVNVGKGTLFNETISDNDTSVECDGVSYYAGSAEDDSAGELDTSQNVTSIESSPGQDGGYIRSSNIEGSKGADVAIKSGNTVLYTIAKGGQGGCYGMNNSFDCVNPNGRQGSLGSGGGGGSCNEAGCGVGGRGGDGAVIVEYKVYCK